MIAIDHVTKRFGERLALDEVTFEIGGGRLTGFVGANGAGKTTTMRVILGLLRPDSGGVTLDGRAVTPGDRRRFGYMPEERGLYPKMKVAEQIEYLGRLRGLTKVAAAGATAELLARLELDARANDTVESLSLGNQQRAQIAAALVHDPEVLILDEPFSGLDPLAVDAVVGVLQERAARGVPVLFSSHQLELVERLCDDLVIISAGTIRAAGAAERLRTDNSTPAWELLTGEDSGWLRAEPGVLVREFGAGWALFEADEATAQRILRSAVGRGSVVSFTRSRPSLAQIFTEVVK
ncbi:ABC transporter ATP-binding protein [Naasia aerilata]|uniref:ABC transporter ATP-binding protein n=1 Tax=Naasia aerilata TaxID=1162966 RepID=A0ABN6XNM3_9MICO|nr:ATP-binding cassette domain-containing protein [Naasia aerilata]BDZ45256.1 ABC transporter ATP-binding protein [Naasia aerilata]